MASTRGSYNHIALNTISVLKARFSQRLISRKSKLLWSVKPIVLSPVDVFFGGGGRAKKHRLILYPRCLIVKFERCFHSLLHFE